LNLRLIKIRDINNKYILYNEYNLILATNCKLNDGIPPQVFQIRISCKARIQHLAFRVSSVLVSR